MIGMVINEALENQLKVTVIVTGVKIKYRGCLKEKKAYADCVSPLFFGGDERI
jgi:cell division GTPase FtsZ